MALHDDVTGRAGRDGAERSESRPPGRESPFDQPGWLRTDRPAPHVRLVRVGGELDLLTTARLEAYLAAELDTRPRALIVDLSEVGFLASMALAALLATHTRAAELGVTVHLTGVTGNKIVARALEVTGLLTRFDIHDDLDDLLAALRRG